MAPAPARRRREYLMALSMRLATRLADQLAIGHERQIAGSDLDRQREARPPRPAGS